MSLPTKALGDHRFYEGPRLIEHNGKIHTASQYVRRMSDPETYIPGIPVFPTCGYPNCVAPEHLHYSITYQRLREEGSQ